LILPLLPGTDIVTQVVGDFRANNNMSLVLPYTTNCVGYEESRDVLLFVIHSTTRMFTFQRHRHTMNNDPSNNYKTYQGAKLC